GRTEGTYMGCPRRSPSAGGRGGSESFGGLAWPDPDRNQRARAVGRFLTMDKVRLPSGACELPSRSGLDGLSPAWQVHPAVPREAPDDIPLHGSYVSA